MIGVGNVECTLVLTFWVSATYNARRMTWASSMVRPTSLSCSCDSDMVGSWSDGWFRGER